MDRHPRRIKVLFPVVNLHLGGVRQTVWNRGRQLDMACALEVIGA